MAKTSKCYTGGKHAIGTPTLGKNAMFQLIRKCRKANEEARGKHEYSEVLRRYNQISP